MGDPFLALLWATALVCQIASADEPLAFVIEGRVESVFAGKHHNAGVFSVSACGRKALIDVVYENGYREMVGTDGRDSFLYSPFSGPDTITNRESIASINYGRFPAGAHPFAQVLWLVCTRNEELLAEMRNIKLYFYGDYAPEEISLAASTNGVPPHLLGSIQWYAPARLASGTNRYELTHYPKGWLLANVSVTETKTAEGVALPAAVAFTRNAMFAIKNASQFAAFHARKPDDVWAVESVFFSVTNARVGRPLSTYVPEVLDATARVHDNRINLVAKVRSGKWWTSQERWVELSQRRQWQRVVIVSLLLSVPLLLLGWRAVVVRKQTTKQNETEIKRNEN